MHRTEQQQLILTFEINVFSHYFFLFNVLFSSESLLLLIFLLTVQLQLFRRDQRR